MRSAIELSDIHDVVLILEYGSLVVVHVKVVGSAKDSHDGGEAGRLGFAIHSISVKVSSNQSICVAAVQRCYVPSILGFMCSDNRK